jgi:hypothetical protein
LVELVRPLRPTSRIAKLRGQYPRQPFDATSGRGSGIVGYNVQTENLEVVADRGHLNGAEILACEEAGTRLVRALLLAGTTHGPASRRKEIARTRSASAVIGIVRVTGSSDFLTRLNGVGAA